MNFFKKQSVGFYFGALTVIVSLVSIVTYMGNCGTDYFKSLGTNNTVVACLVAAAICEAIYIIGNEVVGDKMVLDILPLATAVLIAIGTVTFVSTRVNGMAAIMTFNNNASTMADFNNTVTAIVFCAVALVLSIVTSFMSVVKEN